MSVVGPLAAHRNIRARTRSAQQPTGRQRIVTAAALASLGLATPAAAYCRTTTCEPAFEVCTRDQRGCASSGRPLRQPQACVPLFIQADARSRGPVAPPQLLELTQRAATSWADLRCDGGPSPIEPYVAGLSCAPFGYQPLAPQHNSVGFQDSDWPFGTPGHTLALTLVSYDTRNGELLDADIHINSAYHAFSTEDGAVTNDLLSTLTHELGHVLGFDHSDVPGAAMAGMARPGETSGRVLAADDRAAVCDVYGPRSDPSCKVAPTPEPECKPQPTHGGCQLTVPGPPLVDGLLMTALLLLQPWRHRPRAQRGKTALPGTG